MEQLHQLAERDHENLHKKINCIVCSYQSREAKPTNLHYMMIRPTIINSLFPVLVREKYHAGGRLLFIILLKIIIISRINATLIYSGHINV